LFNVKLLDSFGFKPESKKEHFQNDLPKEEAKQFDPFIPPFEEGLYIDEITSSHRLLFNKYAVSNYHVLVVTSEFESQKDSLNANDFKSVLTITKSLDGFMFFNSGFNSGASILHKHMQVIPYSSLTSS
jgi:ATP adenylyltransferase